MCFEIWSHCSRITQPRSINCPKSKRFFKDSATVSRASSKVPPSYQDYIKQFQSLLDAKIRKLSTFSVTQRKKGKDRSWYSSTVYSQMKQESNEKMRCTTSTRMTNRLNSHQNTLKDNNPKTIQANAASEL